MLEGKILVTSSALRAQEEVASVNALKTKLLAFLCPLACKIYIKWRFSHVRDIGVESGHIRYKRSANILGVPILWDLSINMPDTLAIL